MASEHILLSSEKYDRIMHRLKECESRDSSTEPRGEHKEKKHDSKNETETSVGSSSNGSEQNKVDSGMGGRELKVDDGTKAKDSYKGSNEKGEKGVKGTMNKDRIITKRDLMQKLRPPGHIVGRSAKSSHAKSNKRPAKQTQGDKRRKTWEKL